MEFKSAVAQDDVAAGCDDEARLEIEAGEVRVAFVRIAGEKQLL